MKGDARAALAEANAALQRSEAPYWLDCGSLLGAIREGDFLQHDTDVDFSTWAFAHATVLRCMTQAGMRVKRIFGTPRHGLQHTFQHRSGALVDVFYFYLGTVRGGEAVEERGACWQGSWAAGKLLVSQFDLRAVVLGNTVTLAGVEVPVPRNPDWLLTARYGDWHEVVTEWDWRTDPRCLVEG